MAGQLWGVNAQGGYLANPLLSKTIRVAAQPMLKWRQFVRPEPGMGKGKGASILFDRVSNVATAGGQLSETSRIPETSVTLTQGTVTVTEYGNSIPYTGKLDLLAQFSVDNITTVALRNDMAKVIDQAVHDEFVNCSLKLTPRGTTSSPTVTIDTNGTPSSAAQRDILPFDLKEAADYLEDTVHAEKYDGDNYIAVGRTAGLRKIFDSAEFTNAAQYGDPDRLFAGELGRYYHVRIVKETNASRQTLSAGSAYKGEMVMFGADPIVEGVALPEEIRAKIPEDYGRSKGVAWYALLGWKITFSTGNDGEARIIQITSA